VWRVDVSGSMVRHDMFIQNVIMFIQNVIMIADHGADLGGQDY